LPGEHEQKRKCLVGDQAVRLLLVSELFVVVVGFISVVNVAGFLYYHCGSTVLPAGRTGGRDESAGGDEWWATAARRRRTLHDEGGAGNIYCITLRSFVH